MQLEGRRVLVVGLGVSGAATARVLTTLGARVKVTEGGSSPAVLERAAALRAQGVEVEIGGHDLSDIDADLAVVSPGIPPAAPVMKHLSRGRIDVWSEVELASRLATCDFLAVTGTNGKTTTTTLLAQMLDKSGVKSLAAGNIGLPLIEAVQEVPQGGAIAVEVSSFQLAFIDTFKPRTACILNVAEDHMDWHGSVASYARAKARITENQDGNDVFIPNATDTVAMHVADRTRARVCPFSAVDVPAAGIGVRNGSIEWKGEPLLPVDAVGLPGRAGLEDAMAAAASALDYGLPQSTVVETIRTFAPLRHRFEIVARWRGVTFVDDSKATNPHATIAAVADQEDVVLIAGGRSKGIDLSPMKVLAPRLSAVVALGEAREEIARLFEGDVPVDVVDGMDEAVDRAMTRSSGRGSVLLSPGCASLDMYESYAHRGDDFARAVRDLIAKHEGRGEEGAAHSREPDGI